MWYLGRSKLEGMWLVKSVCEHKHRLLGIDLSQPHLTEFADHCYSYVAPAKVPDYELGKIQWQLYHEERKRAKKAALAARVENEKYFFLGSSEMEKRSKIGEATGIPQNQGRMSLFDAVRLIS